MENVVVYDWLSVTFAPDTGCDDPNKVMIALGMEGATWDVTDGVKGYHERYWCGGINLHTPSKLHPELWLEISGSGCRSFETYGHGDWSALFEWIDRVGGHVTRLDVAYDDHTGFLDPQRLLRDTQQGLYVARSRSHQYTVTHDDDLERDAITIYHGSMASEILIRIYDKAEQLHRDGEHWVRVELQMRRARAVAFLADPHPLGLRFAGVLINYLRYVEPVPGDVNRWRWPTAGYWADLIQDVQRIRLASCMGVKYNLDDVERYVYGQAGNALRCLMLAYGSEVFLQRLWEQGIQLPNKYTQILRALQLENEGGDDDGT